MKLRTMILSAIAFWLYVVFCIYMMGKVGGLI